MSSSPGDESDFDLDRDRDWDMDLLDFERDLFEAERVRGLPVLLDGLALVSLTGVLSSGSSFSSVGLVFLPFLGFLVLVLSSASSVASISSRDFFAAALIFAEPCTTAILRYILGGRIAFRSMGSRVVL